MSMKHEPLDLIFPSPTISLVRPTAPVKGKVVDSKICTRGKSPNFVRHVSIDVSGTPLERSFVAGQAFGIVPPGVDEAGKPHKVRLYSIASPARGEDGNGAVFATGVKRVIDERVPQKPGEDPGDHRLFLGVCSNYLCDVPVGTVVDVTGPQGKRFILPSSPEKWNYVFVATGTGIVPFRSMLMELFGPGAPSMQGQVHLVAGYPYSTDLIYDDYFVKLAKEHSENVQYHTVVSRDSEAERTKIRYTHHLIDARYEIFQDVLESPNTIIYMCGMLGMETGLYQVLVKRGVHERYLRVNEGFLDPKSPAWRTDEAKRAAKPLDRCLVEVY